MNIVICNGKGGTGKTTLTVLLAHALAEAGRRVAILDRDPQGTATKWIQHLDETAVELYDQRETYDAVLTDTPPRLDALTATVKGCDVALLVSSPSPADLWTTKDTADAITRHLHEDARLMLVFNGVRPHTILARELPSMAKRIGVKALKASVSRRQCYQHAALMGWKALDRTAKDEIFSVALEIAQL
jgi:chromosome partitioning protein